MVEQEERKAKQKRMVQRIKIFYGRVHVYKRKTKRTERKNKPTEFGIFNLWNFLH